MRDRDRRIAEELKRRLASVVRIVEFKVFGSRARGDADEYSDLDVFIEVEALDTALRDAISELAWEVGYQNYTVVSPLVYTRDELENSPLRASPIVKVISEEGVAV
jgi:predicted nucleotidyltransferase